MELVLNSGIKYYCLSIFISILIAATDISLDKQFQFNKLGAVFNRWAIPIYLFYGLTTLLIIVLVLENKMVDKLTFTTSAVIGLTGPGLLRSRLKIIDLKQETKINRIFEGIREIFTSQILKSLSISRLKKYEMVAKLPEDTLTDTLNTTIAGESFDKFKEIIQKRKNADPSSVRMFIVMTIANRDPNALDKLYREAKQGKKDS